MRTLRIANLAATASAALLLNLHPATSFATTALAKLSVPELTRRSDTVVHGTVRSIRSILENDRIYTVIEIQSHEPLKGKLTHETVAVRLYGGSHGGFRTAIDGAPSFNRGEELVVFLKANGPETYDVVNLAEGKFRVDRTDPGISRLMRDLSGISYLDRRVEPVIPTTLEGLKAAVREATR